MPYDTYTIEELRCDSNKGMTLIPAFDVVVSRNKTVIDLGTLTDEYEPEITIHTTAADKATGEKSIVAGKSVTIVDPKHRLNRSQRIPILSSTTNRPSLL